MRGSIPFRATVWRRGARSSGTLRPGEDPLALLAEPLNPERNMIAGLEEALRLHPHAAAGRRARRNDVARLQNHEMRDVGNELLHVEDHRRGRPLLHALAIDVEPHVELLHIGDLIPGDEPGPERAECRTTLALHPLAGTLGLEFALGDVVADAIARDEIQSLVLGDVGGAGADDDRKLDLPIRLDRALRNDDVVVGPDDARRRLVE